MEATFAEEGIKFDSSPSKRSKRQSVSPENMERLKVAVKSPIAQQFLAQNHLNRGKTAGFNIKPSRFTTTRPSVKAENSLPNIGGTRASMQLMSPQHGVRVNTLFKNPDANDSLSMNNFADIRLKLGKKKIPDRFQKMVKASTIEGVNDVESIPSEIGTDQWNEINQHDFQLYEQQQREKKNEEIATKVMVKKTLDIQMKERQEQKQKIIEYNQKMDHLMLKKARRELELERRRKYEQSKRVELQKAQRDVMLLEAQKKKIEDFQSMRSGELKEVEKLKQEIQKEKKDLAKVKKTQMEAAQKIIK